MSKKSIKSQPWLIFLGVVLAALILRWWQYELFPIGGETADESAWALLGSSLIQEGVPASWSYFGVYENYHYQEGIFNAPVVRPALDHPPLFSLLPGAAHSLKNYWLSHPSIKLIRAPMVLLGAVNAGLFWLVVKQIFAEKKWQFLATALFVTIPTLVFSSRLVAAENLLITFVLIALWLVNQRSQTWTNKALIAVSALAVLTKISGLIIPGSLIVYGLLVGRKPLVRSAIIGGLVGFGSFVLYGAYYNWELFTKVFLAQSSRELGLVTLQNRLFFNPTVVRHVIFDGWKTLGLFSVFVWLSQANKDKKLLFVHLFTVLGLAFIAITAGEDTIHGWYDYLLWPTLVIGMTTVLRKAYLANDGIIFGLSWLMVLPVGRLALIFLDQYAALSNTTVRLLVGLGFVPLILQAFRQKRAIQLTMAALIILLLVVNVVAVLSITQAAYWEQAAVFKSVF